MRSKPLAVALLCLLVACQSGVQRGAFVPVDAPQTAQADPRTCERRDNDTIAKLEACIKRPWLMRHLAVFAQIAQEHPGSQGHPNRDTGTPGYLASVAYVAGLMRSAGYNVTVQEYIYTKDAVIGMPELATANRNYALERDWFVARRSAAGTVTAPAEPVRGSPGGCVPSDFAGFARGHIAIVQRSSTCDYDTQVENAETAGAAAVILYDSENGPAEARLVDAASIPVIGLVSGEVAANLLQAFRAGHAPTVRIRVETRRKRGVDYNVIADSPYGDPNRTVVVEGHLDAIYGEGMLDNASGSTTILQVALDLAKTPTRNRLRYIWFGGEELGLLGSRYYTTHLTPAELEQIAYDIDADVTATPNFDVLVADPGHATKVKRFPKNVVPQSQIGNAYFTEFFKAGGVISRFANFGNDGTDSFSFSLVGVPNTGILTQQDCCKHAWETKLWGGVLGNYEGKIPSFNGGCVDFPHRWCDDLDNNDPFVFELASKAVAYVTFKLANRPHLPRRSHGGD